jgi:hypothetical protein
MQYTILTSTTTARNPKKVPMHGNRYNWNFLAGVEPGDMAVIKVSKKGAIDNIRRSVQRAGKPRGLQAKAVDNLVLVW